MDIQAAPNIMSQVFYRKYRPQSLSDLVGQTQVKKTLSQAFAEDKLAHAYLFCGPRGTGKTSTARILAKMVNCERQTSDKVSRQSSESLKADSSIPCNQCPQCLSITEGSNLDLIEIDAASNRGIDDIRSLRDNIKLSPTGAHKKVYIIDEVHMLTNEAFNALLKTLEEPPAHVLFILATTEAHKIPVTILSRVQKLDFKLATPEEMVEALQKVVQGESLQVSPEALQLIAKKAEGSFRDGVKLVDQLSSAGEVTVELIEASVQSGNFDNLVDLLKLIALKDARGALELLFKQSELGINVKEYILSCLDLMRSMLFIKHGLRESIGKSLGQEKAAQLEVVAAQFSMERLILVLDYFQKGYEKTRFASIPLLPLEIAVVESCQDQGTGVRLQDRADSPLRPQSQATQQTAESPDLSRGTPIETIGPTELKMVVLPPENSQNPLKDGSDDMQVIADKWNYILETIRPQNFSLEALLRSVKVVDCVLGKVMIEVPYSFHQRILETPKSRDLLEAVLTDVLGKPSQIKTILGKKPSRSESLANVELAADDEIIRIASEIFSSDAP